MINHEITYDTVMKSSGVGGGGAGRAGLNECEASGKVVTARPPKRLAQLRSSLLFLQTGFADALQKFGKCLSNLW